ncbi:MAG: carotenoid oxygenase family protein, partial [bacterium]
MASAPIPAADLSTNAPRVAAEWAGLFDTVAEHDAPITQIEGTIPAGLIGTLYRNGPGVHDYAESFFDGDGLIRALTFREDSTVHFKSRYVRTPKYEKQARLGRAVGRG